MIDFLTHPFQRNNEDFQCDVQTREGTEPQTNQRGIETMYYAGCHPRYCQQTCKIQANARSEETTIRAIGSSEDVRGSRQRGSP